jgi:hypothetical protein
LTYLLTYSCYGTHLPGDQRGSVDRTRGNRQGGYREPSAALESHAKKLMLDDPYTLDLSRARLVLAAIREVGAFRGWDLLAAHVRSTHVHCVVGQVAVPNRAIADFKAYASRALNRFETSQRRWARGGNTLSLANRRAIHAAVGYVADSQGEAMAVYVSDGDWEDEDVVVPELSPP